jgi:hypothetical protein
LLLLLLLLLLMMLLLLLLLLHDRDHDFEYDYDDDDGDNHDDNFKNRENPFSCQAAVLLRFPSSTLPPMSRFLAAGTLSHM